METLTAKTFHHHKICWVCSKERLRKGTWTYCESCEEYHFIYNTCIPNYTENKIPTIRDRRKNIITARSVGLKILLLWLLC